MLAIFLGVLGVTACGDDALVGPTPTDSDASATDASLSTGATEPTGAMEPTGGAATGGATVETGETTGTSSEGVDTLDDDVEPVCGDGVVEGDEECDDATPWCEQESCTWACDVDGECLGDGWVRSVGGRGMQRLVDAVATPDGGDVIVVEFIGVVRFDAFELAYKTGNLADLAVIKRTAEGEVAWVHSFGGPGRQFANDAAVDADGDIYVVGGFEHELTLGDQLLESSPSDHHDMGQFVVKLSGQDDVEDRLLWAHEITQFDPQKPDEHARGVPRVTVDASGRAYVAGFAWNQLTLDDEQLVLSRPGRRFAYLLGFNSSGALVPELLRDFVAHDPEQLDEYTWDQTDALEVDALGNLFWAGVVDYTLELGGGELLNAEGGGSAFIFKYATDGALAWTRELHGHVDGFTLEPDDEGGLALALANHFMTGSFGCGESPEPESVLNLWIARYDGDGGCAWTRGYEPVQISNLELMFHGDGLLLAGVGEYLPQDVAPDFGGGPVLDEAEFSGRADYFVALAEGGEHLWSAAHLGNSSDTLLRWGSRMRLVERQGGLTLVEDYNEDVDAQGLSREHGLLTVTLDGDGVFSDWTTYGAYTEAGSTYGVRAMAVDGGGNAVVAGEIEGPLYVDDAYQQLFHDYRDTYLARFLADGQLHWTAGLEEITVRDVAASASGDLWIAGDHRVDTTLQGCELPMNGDATTNYFVAQLSPDGACLGRAQFHEHNTHELGQLMQAFTPRLFTLPGTDAVTLVGVVDTDSFEEGSFLQLGDAEWTSGREIVRVTVEPETYAFESLRRRALGSDVSHASMTPSGELVIASPFRNNEPSTDWDGQPLEGYGTYLVQTTPTLEKEWDFVVPKAGWYAHDHALAVSDASVHLAAVYNEYNAVVLPGAVHTPGEDKRLVVITLDAAGAYQWSSDYEFAMINQAVLADSGELVMTVAKSQAWDERGWGFLRIDGDGGSARYVASDIARGIRGLYPRPDGGVLFGAHLAEPSTEYTQHYLPMMLLGVPLEIGDLGGALVARIEFAEP